MTMEEKAEQTAARIVDLAKMSAFVSSDHQKVWIKTAIMDAYAAGRVSVFQEDMAALLKNHGKKKCEK